MIISIILISNISYIHIYTNSRSLLSYRLLEIYIRRSAKRLARQSPVTNVLTTHLTNYIY